MGRKKKRKLMAVSPFMEELARLQQQVASPPPTAPAKKKRRRCSGKKQRTPTNPNKKERYWIMDANVATTDSEPSECSLMIKITRANLKDTFRVVRDPHDDEELNKASQEDFSSLPPAEYSSARETGTEDKHDNDENNETTKSIDAEDTTQKDATTTAEKYFKKCGICGISSTQCGESETKKKNIIANVENPSAPMTPGKDAAVDGASIGVAFADASVLAPRKFVYAHGPDMSGGDCGDGIVNPFPKDVVADKYWAQRRRFFSRFEDGIVMDHEGWFSVTPEAIANHIAKRMSSMTRKHKLKSSQTSNGAINENGEEDKDNRRDDEEGEEEEEEEESGDDSDEDIDKCSQEYVSDQNGLVVLDAFCGCGGNTIAFARRKDVSVVVAVDHDIVKLRHAAHNAHIYGIPPHKVVFLNVDACRFLHYWQTSTATQPQRPVCPCNIGNDNDCNCGHSCCTNAKEHKKKNDEISQSSDKNAATEWPSSCVVVERCHGYPLGRIISTASPGNDDTNNETRTTCCAMLWRHLKNLLLPNHIDAIFLSPPWGGMDYETVHGPQGFSLSHIRLLSSPHCLHSPMLADSHPNDVGKANENNNNTRVVDGEELLQVSMKALSGSSTAYDIAMTNTKLPPNKKQSNSSVIAYFLPRNTNGMEIGRSALRIGCGTIDEEIEMEQEILNGKLKAITAYFRI